MRTDYIDIMGDNEMTLTPKENYLRTMEGELPEYIPAPYIEPWSAPLPDELLTPNNCPNGPITTVYGVTYVGSADLLNGAMPKPGEILLDDITKWRDVIKNPDLTGRDWEGYYNSLTKNVDRSKLAVKTVGGDYFLTLVSFMGFEGALIAMHEEPEEVYALFEYVSEFYLEVMRKQIQYAKPEVYTIMDDDAAKLAPFFSLDMYRRLVKPFHKKHADLALENGIYLDRHDCGHCEIFIDDWLEMGIKSWNPAQVCNDLVGIKKKYGDKLIIAGAWDTTGPIGRQDVDPETLRAALYEYVDTFAPGGGFNYCANIQRQPSEELYQEKMAIVRDVYYNYARDYYKTH